MCKWKAERDPRSANLINIEETVMDAAMERRIVVATGWASTRIAVLDKEERYEDSYAITQEFCEWITCIGENVEMFEAMFWRSRATRAKGVRFTTPAPTTHKLKSEVFLKFF